MRKVRGTAKANVGAGKSELGIRRRRRKDSAVSSSIVIVQMFHERINKL